MPLYRRKEYKGNLTGDEKRYLDSFRLEEKHPATAVEDLPEEVQSYLSELELAVYACGLDLRRPRGGAVGSIRVPP